MGFEGNDASSLILQYLPDIEFYPEPPQNLYRLIISAPLLQKKGLDLNSYCWPIIIIKIRMCIKAICITISLYFTFIDFLFPLAPTHLAEFSEEERQE